MASVEYYERYLKSCNRPSYLARLQRRARVGYQNAIKAIEIITTNSLDDLSVVKLYKPEALPTCSQLECTSILSDRRARYCRVHVPQQPRKPRPPCAYEGCKNIINTKKAIWCQQHCSIVRRVPRKPCARPGCSNLTRTAQGLFCSRECWTLARKKEPALKIVKETRSEEAIRCARRANEKRYRESHREERQATRIATRYRKRQAEGSFTADEMRRRFEILGNVCFYCKMPGKLTVDHDVPLSRGGSNLIGNILPACRPCNAKKHTLTAEEYILRETQRNIDKIIGTSRL